MKMEVPSPKVQVAFQNLRKLKQATLPFEIVKMNSKHESSSFKRQRVDVCDTDEVILLSSDGDEFLGVENCDKIQEKDGCSYNSSVTEKERETIIPQAFCQIEMMEESCNEKPSVDKCKTDMSVKLNESGNVSLESSNGILKECVSVKSVNENASVQDVTLVSNKRKIDSNEQPKAQKPPKRAKLIYHVDKLRTCEEKVSVSETKVEEVKLVNENHVDEVAEVKHESENSEENKNLNAESGENECNLKQSCLRECLQVVCKSPCGKVQVLEEPDVSVSEENCKTPKPKGSPPGKNVKKLTPKQLQRQAEATKRREELQQEREQKKKKKEEEKVRIKLEKEEEKVRIKQEKEEEKRKLKEEKEKRKQAEIEMKIKEKQQKDEEKRRKKEEQKLEEKRKKEELQRKKEEEELLKKRTTKEAEAFSNFFKKCGVKTSGPLESDNSSNEIVFMPFTVKSDMRLAPINRNPMDDERLSKFEDLLVAQSQDKTYLEELRLKVMLPKKVGNTWPLEEKYNDVIVVEDLDLKDEVTVVPQKKFSDRKPKLLQFCENRRPPYWGTWRKKSKTIRPKNPLGKDEIFDYEVDSDEEWEEEEPGESLHGSDDEKESEDEYEVDNDFFVPHGYLSDDENPEEEEKISPETQKAKLKLLGEQFDLERSEKTKLLKPITLGCVWFASDSDEPVSVNSSVIKFLNTRKAVPWQDSVPILLPPEDDEDCFNDSKSDLKSENLDTEENTENGSTKPMPELAVAELIDLIHGSSHSVRKLARMFVLKWKKKTETKCIDKKGKVYRPFVKHIERKIKELANWEEYPEQGPDFGKKCWYVEKEIREKYGDLDDSQLIKEEKKPTLITNFTKVLTEDEKKNQMTKSSVRKSFSSLNSTSETTPNSPRSQSVRPKCTETLHQFWANPSLNEKYSKGVSAVEDNMEGVVPIEDLPQHQDDCSVVTIN